MVLRITVRRAGPLREAIQAVPVGGSTMVIVIWNPKYFSVQSMLSEKLGEGQNPTTLLKLQPESFSYYESTDNYFNAIVEAAGLESVFFVAKNEEPLEFSQSLEDDNGLNDLGFLRVRFNRQLLGSDVAGDIKDDCVSFKIYGMLPEKTLKSADVTNDPSLYPSVPLATFCVADFVTLMATLETLGMSVTLQFKKDKVIFITEESKFIMTRKEGVITLRDDVEGRLFEFKLHLQNLDINPSAKLSDLVLFYHRSEGVILLWFFLSRPRTLLKGDLVFYYY